MLTARVVFLSSLGLLVYLYLGYPALIALLARLRPRPVAKAAEYPPVSILLAAHNEASTVARKLESCLALRYPGGRVEIVLASDGSTDDTEAVARRYEPAGVSVRAFPVRRGKPSVLNDCIPACRGEIDVLGDARQTFDPGVLEALVESFADPAVGAVSGELMLSGHGSAVAAGVGFYWRYEKLIRRSESRFDSTVGATGALYAIRRELFAPIPGDTLLDDVLIPLRIVRQGRRVLFEPAAKAFDRAADTARQESTRKIRTIAGTLQLLQRERWLWNPWANRLWLQTVSHKVLRLTGPLLLGSLLASTVVLATESRVYGVALGAQLGFYAAALAGSVAGRRSSLLAVPYAFCMLNWITLVGVWQCLAGRQAVTWTKADAAGARTPAVPTPVTTPSAARTAVGDPGRRPRS